MKIKRLSTKQSARLGLVLCTALAAVAFTLIPRDRIAVTSQPGYPFPDPAQEVRLYTPSPTSQATDLAKSVIVGQMGRKVSFDTLLNGASQDVHLWKDDTHKIAEEDYFPFNKEGGRQLQSEATFDPLSGDPGEELFTSHSVYRIGSGLLERHGKLWRDGRYQQTYMMDDSDKVIRDRWFDSLRQFTSETVYKWNSAHTATYAFMKVFKADFNGQYWVSFYREDDSRLATLKVSPGTVEGSMFDKDGSTLVAEWASQTSMLGQSYYALYDQGSKTPTRVWKSDGGRMTVVVAKPNSDRVIFKQVWKERPDPSSKDGKRYLLVNAATLDPASDTITRINMSGNGKLPTQIEVDSQKGKSTVKDLDDTGRKVVKTETRDASGSTVMPVKAKEELVEIDPAMLVMPLRPDVPSYEDKDAPPRLYDYK